MPAPPNRPTGSRRPKREASQGADLAESTFVYEPIFGSQNGAIELVSCKRELRSNRLLVVVSIFGYGAFFG